MKRVNVAVFDLDNTLYDWYASFIPAFYAMVDAIVEIFGCDREALLDELRDVHRKHHNVEHPYSALETPTLQAELKRFGESAVREKLDPAFHTFNRIRKHNLSLFPGALETLEELRARQIKLVAFTDSSYHSTLRRIRQLNLQNTFGHIFCRAKSESLSRLASVSPLADDLARKTVELPANEVKPNPAVLKDIAARENVPISLLVYIGDSISRDVLMAKRAGCCAVWAKYGVHRDPAMYEKLVRISHWTDEDIARERNFAEEASTIIPDFVCERSPLELLKMLEGPQS
jgi:FMN phosphatase YigB (HAD superfamily)